MLPKKAPHSLLSRHVQANFGFSWDLVLSPRCQSSASYSMRRSRIRPESRCPEFDVLLQGQQLRGSLRAEWHVPVRGFWMVLKIASVSHYVCEDRLGLSNNATLEISRYASVSRKLLVWARKTAVIAPMDSAGYVCRKGIGRGNFRMVGSHHTCAYAGHLLRRVFLRQQVFTRFTFSLTIWDKRYWSGLSRY